MFSILRFVLIVGVIFYYSPVRQPGDGIAVLEAWLAPKKAEPAGTAPQVETGPGHLEAVWQALPNSAKQAVIDGILASPRPSKTDTKATDTLQAADRQLQWRGEGTKPRS